MYIDSDTAEKYLDSLWLLAEEEEADELRANFFLKKARLYRYQANNDSSFYFYDKSLKTFERLNHKKGIAQVWVGMSAIYTEKHEWNLAIQYLDQSAEYFRQEEDYRNMGIVYHNKGNIHANIGNYGNANDHYEKALHFFRRAEDSSAVAATLASMVRIPMNQGDYTKCLELLRSALLILQQPPVKDSYKLAAAYGNLGAVLLKLDKNQEASFVIKKTLEITERLKYPNLYLNTLFNISAVYQTKGANSEALTYLERAIKFSSDLDVGLKIRSASLTNASLLYAEIGQYEKAMKYIRESLAIDQSIDDKNGSATCYVNIGDILQAQGHYLESLTHYRKSLALAKDLGNLELMKLNNHQMMKSYEHLNRFEEALNCSVLFQQYGDSIFNIEKQEKIEALTIQYKVDIKEAQIIADQQRIELLIKSNELKKRRLMMLVGGGLMFLVIAIVLIALQKKRVEVNKTQKDLALNRLEKAQLNESRMLEQLDFHKSEMDKYISKFNGNRIMVKKLQSELLDLRKTSKENGSWETTKLSTIVEENLHNESDWNDFLTHFEVLNSDLLTRLQSEFQELTANDLKHIALIQLNMSLKETANILNITVEGVKKARQRLRSKVLTSEDQDLKSFINSRDGP
ncbi:MAG: tetratricopeptide repeat protein [Flavobacteriales bacterium]|nr:tetratricopeptide repeat protein [Flavobacteriales bacterium]